jgi:hypothetical protein
MSVTAVALVSSVRCATLVALGFVVVAIGIVSLALMETRFFVDFSWRGFA